VLSTGKERGGGGGILSEIGLAGGDAEGVGVSELTTELVDELSSSSRKAVSLGRFEAGAIISSSSLSESSVMQSTVFSGKELVLKRSEDKTIKLSTFNVRRFC
jgi:hypothetical protein